MGWKACDAQGVGTGNQRKHSEISAISWKGKVDQRERTDPLVVGLVDVLVDERVVLDSVDPVDSNVGEQEEERNRSEQVQPPVVGDLVVEHAVTAHLGDEPGDGHEVQPGEGLERVDDLLSNLILKEPGVLHHPVVEDVVVGEARHREVHEVDADVDHKVLQMRRANRT
jgi:hypothetical protein